MVVDWDRSERPMVSTERDQRDLCIYSKNPLVTATEVQATVVSLKLSSLLTIKMILDKVV